MYMDHRIILSNCGPPVNRTYLHAKYNNMCARCMVSPSAHIHEILPRSAGGKLVEENQIPLCARCHEIVHTNWKAHYNELIQYQERARQYNPEIKSGLLMEDL